MFPNQFITNEMQTIIQTFTDVVGREIKVGKKVLIRVDGHLYQGRITGETVNHFSVSDLSFSNWKTRKMTMIRGKKFIKKKDLIDELLILG